MNKLIVKPMPQAKATPAICAQVTPRGSDARPKTAAMATKPRMPIGLPRKSPAANAHRHGMQELVQADAG